MIRALLLLEKVTAEKTKGKNEENGGKEKTDENSGHYVIASSQRPERQPLEHRTLVPILFFLKAFWRKYEEYY